ncbi:MAG: pyridoxamine 5'-phosphate oxidase family protein [Oscillospiraceae bacterium]|nr:pyridoxamine 5'-phosphate oxidase family protein [Oscillospiraceae bacterium]
MFRKMRRFRQQLSEEACLAVLKTETRGVLSMIGEDGYPYGIPMNHWYCEEDGKLYFHGAREGQKIDLMQRNDKVCYTVYDRGFREEGEWALHVKSVVVFGRISLVADEEKAKTVCTALCRKFTDDEDYLKRELAHALSRVQCLALTPEHMTGKLVKES